jgi:hypothetical protein
LGRKILAQSEKYLGCVNVGVPACEKPLIGWALARKITRLSSYEIQCKFYSVNLAFSFRENQLYSPLNRYSFDLPTENSCKRVNER